MLLNLTKEPTNTPPANNIFGSLGRFILFQISEVGRSVTMLLLAFFEMRRIYKRRARRETIIQMYIMGIKSLGVITTVAVFIGMILALQTGLELRRWNQEMYIGAGVMVTMLREMAPLMTGLILAACVGSSIAAQVATMTVNEEIAALEIMSIDPIEFLMTPRLLAILIMIPLLSFYTTIMGVTGGAVVGVTQLNVVWARYWDYALEYAVLRDLYVGLLKSCVYGVIIVMIACHQGFAATGGAVGVGFATRRAVVSSFLVILVAGYFITQMFYV